MDPLWLVLLIGNGTLGGYIAYLWFHGHQHVLLLQGSPQGLHGRGFLAYLALVMVLVAITPWVLLEGHRLGVKALIVLIDLGAFLVYQHALTGPQAYFTSTVAVTAFFNSVFLYPALAFHALGPLFEGRGSASSLEVER